MLAYITQRRCSGTVFQVVASSTMAEASIKPKPK